MREGRVLPAIAVTDSTPSTSVYRAHNYKEQHTAACKVVCITEKTTEKRRRSIDNEIRVHTAMRHPNIVEFYRAYRIGPESNHGGSSRILPGIYMLMEFARGGNLFDKIGESGQRT